MSGLASRLLFPARAVFHRERRDFKRGEELSHHGMITQGEQEFALYRGQGGCERGEILLLEVMHIVLGAVIGRIEIKERMPPIVAPDAIPPIEALDGQSQVQENLYSNNHRLIGEILVEKGKMTLSQVNDILKVES